MIRTSSESSATPFSRKFRRGAAAVEFAMVAPFFVVMILGMIEIGRALMVQEILINAAREGARKATLSDATDKQVLDTVTNALTSTGVTDYTTTVTPSTTSAVSGTNLTVKVTVPVDKVSWVPGQWLLPGKDFTAVVVMRKE